LTKNIKNQKLNNTKLVEILFFTFPLSFIIGNFALSLHLLLFIGVSLFLIKREQLAFRFNNSYWLLVVFFLYFFLSTTIQFQSPGLLNEGMQDWSLENNPIFKSFVLIRFLILVFVIDTLFFNKILNLKKLALFSLACTSFVSFDVILQYFMGFDLFGLKSLGTRNSGPFGDEVIAGSFLQKFSFLSIFCIYEIFKNKNFNGLLLTFIITFHTTAILLAGNRIPMLLFLLGCVLIIMFIKNLRLVMISSVVIFLAIFYVIVVNDKGFEKRYVSQIQYNLNILKLDVDTPEKSITKDEKNLEDEKNYDGLPKTLNFLRTSGHGRIYRTSLKMWEEQPLIGFGLKSFRIKCWDILKKWEGSERVASYACSNHPHNYYLELLSEAGIVGTSLMIIFFLILIKNSFFYLIKFKRITDPEKYLLISFIIVFLLEIWPIRSSGSFFSTWNSTFFWLSVAMLFTTNTKKTL